MSFIMSDSLHGVLKILWNYPSFLLGSMSFLSTMTSWLSCCPFHMCPHLDKLTWLPSGTWSRSSSIPLFTTRGLVCPSWVVPHSSGMEEGWNCTITYRGKQNVFNQTNGVNHHLTLIGPECTFGLCMTMVSPDGNSSLRCHWLVDTAFLYSDWKTQE